MASYVASLSNFDTNLAARLRQSEEGVFQEVFHRFSQRVFRTALRILKEEESAKDAVQETMINVYRAAKSFRGEAKLSTWINRIAVNVCLEMIRKNKKHSNRTPEDISDHVNLIDAKLPDPHALTRSSEVRARVRAALSRLTQKHREVVEMHDLAGYTIKEIAGLVSVAEGTIKSRLFYGREELRKQLVS